MSAIYDSKLETRASEVEAIERLRNDEASASLQMFQTKLERSSPDRYRFSPDGNE